MTGRQQKQTAQCLPDISTLLRVGHFYFALTQHLKAIDILVFVCYQQLRGKKQWRYLF